MFKILTVGDSATGKTSMLYRYVNKHLPQDTIFVPTIGVDFYVHKTDGVSDALFWDTGGMERYHSICQHYYTGAHGIVLVYDASHSESQIREHIMRWYGTMNEKVVGMFRVPVAIVGNKIDLCMDRLTVVPAVVHELQLQHDNIRHYCTSAVTGLNVCEMFDDTLARCKMSMEDPLVSRTSMVCLARHNLQDDSDAHLAGCCNT